jgi:hypothetical protein
LKLVISWFSCTTTTPSIHVTPKTLCLTSSTFNNLPWQMGP